MAIQLVKVAFPKTGKKGVIAENRVFQEGRKVFADSVIKVIYVLEPSEEKVFDQEFRAWRSSAKAGKPIPTGIQPTITALAGGSKYSGISASGNFVLEYSTRRYPVATHEEIAALARAGFRIAPGVQKLMGLQLRKKPKRSGASPVTDSKGQIYRLIFMLRKFGDKAKQYRIIEGLRQKGWAAITILDANNRTIGEAAVANGAIPHAKTILRRYGLQGN